MYMYKHLHIILAFTFRGEINIIICTFPIQWVVQKCRLLKTNLLIIISAISHYENVYNRLTACIIIIYRLCAEEETLWGKKRKRKKKGYNSNERSKMRFCIVVFEGWDPNPLIDGFPKLETSKVRSSAVCSPVQYMYTMTRRFSRCSRAYLIFFSLFQSKWHRVGSINSTQQRIEVDKSAVAFCASFSVLIDNTSMIFTRISIENAAQCRWGKKWNFLFLRWVLSFFFRVFPYSKASDK